MQLCKVDYEVIQTKKMASLHQDEWRWSKLLPDKKIQ